MINKGSVGDIGAFMTIDQNNKIITSFSDDLTIDLNLKNELVSFTVSADDGASATILVIRIGEGVLSDLDNLVVTYDEDIIDEVFDVEKFFDLEGNTDLGWLRFLTITGLYIFIRVPHFSTHTITISSIIDVLSGPYAIMIYIAISTTALILFLGPPITRLTRKLFFQYKK